MQRLSGQDAAFLYLDTPGAHLNLTGLYIYEQPDGQAGKLGFAQIRELIRSALDGVSELSRKLYRPPLDIDYPIWLDDPDFDFDQHVLRHSGRTPRSRKALYQLVAAIHAEPLDLSLAPWQMHVLENLNRIPGLPPHCFAIVMKYHHAAIDGASGAMLIDRLHGIQRAQEPSSTTQRAPGTPEMLMRALVNNVGSGLALVRAIADAAPVALRQWRDTAPAGRQKKPPVPDTRFNHAVSTRRVLYTTAFSLQHLRTVRQGIRDAAPSASGTTVSVQGRGQGRGPTINDVLLTLCAGALRRWLSRRDELPLESLVAMVPVNTRAEGEDELPGNRIATLFLPIGTHIENPLERALYVQAVTQQAKSGEHGLAPQQVNAIARNIPALPLSIAAQLSTGLGLAYRGPRLCNCTITNVPANREGLHLGPAPLLEISGSGPLLDGMGLLISITSYAEIINLSFTSCPEMLSDPEELARDAEHELASLERVLRNSR